LGPIALLGLAVEEEVHGAVEVSQELLVLAPEVGLAVVADVGVLAVRLAHAAHAHATRRVPRAVGLARKAVPLQVFMVSTKQGVHAAPAALVETPAAQLHIAVCLCRAVWCWRRYAAV